MSAMKRFDWDDLRYFLAIARHGTLSGAARTLAVQQSTMSRRLDALEQRAGAQLLQKTPDGYVLTVAGEAILAHVERIEVEAQAVERTITGADLRLEGSIRITTIETLAVEVLTPVFAEFCSRYPGITLEMLAEQRSLSLNKREADVALRLARFTQQDLVVRKLAELGFGIYASSEYLEQHGQPDFTAGAAGHRLVLPHEEAMGLPEMAWFGDLSRRAGVALRSNSRFACLAAVQAGMGIACLARYLADGKGLVRLKTGRVAPKRELWLAVHADIRHTPRIRALNEALAEGLRTRSACLNPIDD